MRVVLVDDSVLFRRGLAGLLTAAGLDVVADLADPAALDAVLATARPDLVILDIRMPPTHTDEGIRAALSVKQAFPGVGVLVLSTYAEGVWARRLFADGANGLGYLLKDRVDDVPALVDAMERIAGGGTAVDQEVVVRLLENTNRTSALAVLTEREHDVLALMAEGRSNIGIGKALHLSARTVESYIAAIFAKLPLQAEDNTQNRRVLSVLSYLHEMGSLRA
ncbi:MAG TPA: response regulator transcription factor [Dermatophilaceae bacterium]|nr:response regulator transcription factor [Dermatophilaceae bacterium]